MKTTWFIGPQPSSPSAHLPVWIALSGLGLVLLLPGALGDTTLEVERSAAVTGTWEKVPLVPDMLTPGGGITESPNAQNLFYRLKIAQGPAEKHPFAVTLSELPQEAVETAQEYLESSDAEEWQGAALNPTAYLLFDPAVSETEAAYAEIKVVPSQSLAGQAALQGGGIGGTEVLPFPLPIPIRIRLPLRTDFRLLESRIQPDLGYIIVSLRDNDVQVVESTESGPTTVERLLDAAPSRVTRPVRYGSSFLVGEDDRKQAVASFGTIPLRQHPNLVNRRGVVYSTIISNNVLISEAPPLADAPTAFATYGELRSSFVGDPVFARIRRDRLASLRPLNQALRTRQAEEIQVREVFGVRQPILVGVPIEEYEAVAGADGSQPVVTRFVPGAPQAGLVVVGLKSPRQFALYYKVLGADPNDAWRLAIVTLPGAALQGWSFFGPGSWSQAWTAGTWNDQLPYGQVWNLSPNCWSGCGPTAWAMFYGYWDRKGVANLIGGTESTPRAVNQAVKDCIQYVHDQCGTFCLFHQGATAPWDMWKGYRWAAERGEFITMRWDYLNIAPDPIIEYQPLTTAKNSIMRGYPAIVGLDFLQHYALAYGYRFRRHFFFGVPVYVEHQWLINDGWATGVPKWVTANTCWFGTHGYCL